jgi:hypothetical protein
MLVSTIFKYAASDAKGKYESPTDGSTEWNQWLSWLNEELQSFGEVHDWPELTLQDHCYPSVAASSTSVALPSNYKKFAAPVVIAGTQYGEVDDDLFRTYASTSKVFHDGYNNGWYLEWKVPLSSATSVLAPIVVYPSTLATSTDSVNIRNPMYLVKRLKTRIFKYRQDPIFPEMEAEADLMLQQMIENEYYKHNQYEGGAITREEEQNFILGED